jgi:beta-glucosidase
VKLNDFLPPGLGATWNIELTGQLRVPTTGPFEFGLAVAGRARLFVNGKEAIDNWTRQRPGEFFYG